MRSDGGVDDRRARRLAEAAREVDPREEEVEVGRRRRRRRSWSGGAGLAFAETRSSSLDVEARRDRVLQERPRPHWRELVRVPDEDQARSRFQGAQQSGSERGVEQRGLVDEQRVVRERVLSVVLEGLDVAVVVIEAGCGVLLLLGAAASGEEAVELFFLLKKKRSRLSFSFLSPKKSGEKKNEKKREKNGKRTNRRRREARHLLKPLRRPARRRSQR